MTQKIKTQPGIFQRITETSIFKITKYAVYIAIALALVGSIAYLNVIKTYSPTYPTFVSSDNEGLILDKTAAIIARDGNIPLKVAKKYSIWIYEAAAKYALDPTLLLAVMYNESKFDYKAISPTGPIGLFQIASSYHKEKSTKAALFDPYNNIMVGAWILREYTDLSKSKVETLLRYNGSLGQAPKYALKVISTKRKYDNEIMNAIAI